MASTNKQGPFQLTWVVGPSKERKKRFSSKVKTGCETCKKRRIKCDEGKPACANCNRSGRQCEGYQASSLGRYRFEYCDPVARMPQPLQPQYGRQGDKTLLDLFLQRTATQLVKFSNPYFWYTLLPQVSRSHDAIRHGVAAVALACSEHDTPCKGLITRQTQSLNHYNAAIRAVTHVAGGTTPPDIMLICCVLFWLFENLKNRPCVALTHLKAAIHMLNERPRLPNYRDDIISNYLEPLLQEGMTFVATVLPTGGRQKHEAPATMGAFISAIEKLQPSGHPKDLHACQHDFGRCQEGMAIAKRMQMSASSPDPAINLVRNLYTDWKHALERNAYRWPLEYVRMLRMHFASQMMSLDIVESSITGQDKRANGAEWRPRLQWILDEARYFARLRQQQTADPNHKPIINVSLITPLAIVARQCLPRDDDFADEAIGLLEEYEWFEGIWNSKIAGELVRLMRTTDAEQQLCSTGDLEAVFARAAGIKEVGPVTGIPR